MAENKKKNYAETLGYHTSALLNSADKVQRKASNIRNPRDEDRSRIQSSDVDALRTKANSSTTETPTLSHDRIHESSHREETVQIKTEAERHSEVAQRMERPSETVRVQDSVQHFEETRQNITNTRETPVSKLPTAVEQTDHANSDSGTRTVDTIRQNTGGTKDTVTVVTEQMKHDEVAQRISKNPEETIRLTEKGLHGQTLDVMRAQGVASSLKTGVPTGEGKEMSVRVGQNGVQEGVVAGSTITMHTQEGDHSAIGSKIQKTDPLKGQVANNKEHFTLKTDVATEVQGDESDLQVLSKSMQNGTFQKKQNPNAILQTRIDNGPKGTFKVNGEDFAGNDTLEFENIQKMLDKKKYSNLLPNETKQELLRAVARGEISATQVQRLLKGAYGANRSGIYMKNEDGSMRSLAQIRAMGAANRLVSGKTAGATKLSKATTVGLKGASKTAKYGAKAAKGLSKATAAAQKGIDDEVVNAVEVMNDAVKQKAGLVVQNKVRQVGWKATSKVGRWFGKSVGNAIRVSLNFVRALLVKFMSVFGGFFLTVCFPLFLAVVLLVGCLTIFMGSDASKDAYNTLFAAETSEFQSRRQDKLTALEQKKQSPPPMSDFEGITLADYNELINSQFIPDTVTTEGNSEIDYKAQLTHFQILSGAREISNKHVKSDFLTIIRYWDEQGIIESYRESTASYPYTVHWVAHKKQPVDASAEGNTRDAAIDAAKQLAYAKADSGWRIASKKGVRATSWKAVYRKVPILDKDGKETGKFKKVLDHYEATVAGDLELEKDMEKGLTQYIYTLHIANGDYEDYVNLSQKAYRDNVELTVSNYSIGKEGFGTTVITDGSQKKNMEAIWGFLKKNGFTDEAAAGVLGNIQAESHFDPGCIEASNGEGHGIVQWSYERKIKLFQMAAARGVPWNDMGVQLDLLLQEFNAYSYRPYFNSPEEFKKSKDIRKTTEAFMICFERPQNQSEAAIAGRTNNSNGIYDQLHGKNIDTSNNSGRILWVGDSRTVGMSQAVQSNDKDVWIAKVAEGYNWFVNTAIDKVNTSVRPNDRIVINLGVNDLHNARKYVKKINELVEGPWKNVKSIQFMSVNPIDESKWPSVKNSQIEEFNRTVKANLNKKVRYVDTYSKLKGNIETTDGLHYTNNTYSKIYAMVRGNSNGQKTYGTMMSVDASSKHFNKTYYYEELISQQFLVHKEPSKQETADPKPNTDQTKPNAKSTKTTPTQKKKKKKPLQPIDRTEISPDILAQMDTLYQSEFLMEGFDFLNLTYGVSGFESFGFDGAIQDPIKKENSTSLDYGKMFVPGNPFAKPQCTWFAWARFYQVYGYDSGARGHGKYNAQQVVAAHPDKFQMSSTPAPGAVFSIYSGPYIIPEYGHVGFIEAVEGDTMWVSEGNVTLDGTPGVMWFHKVSVSEWQSKYQIEYAVPKK